jgi:alpha-galactosidase
LLGLVAAALLLANSVAAQEFITISTRDNTLMLKVTEAKRVEQVYFGESVKNVGELQLANPSGQSAYSTFGGSHVNEAALRAVQADGNTSTDLVYLSHRSERKDDNIVHTVVALKDSYYDLFVDLHYNAYQKENVVEQWVEVRNGQKKAVQLHNFASADLTFGAQSYYVTSFRGDWADEMNMDEQRLVQGIKLIESKLGVRTNERGHAAFLLSLGAPAEEDYGRVVGGTLAYPGSFRLCFEVDHRNSLRVLSGANPYASTYTLEAGKTFTTPAFLYTYSASGTGEVSRRFHRWGRTYGIKNGSGERSILLNNWEATYFDFDEAKLTQIIDDAAKMGFELFLLDDGWFGNKYPRNNDTQGLGDWQTNVKKLPRGIPYLIDECRKRNIKFGIWVEPEMVSVKSELYEKHPDWIITQPHRELDFRRNQLLLDLGNPKVQDFVFGAIDKILTDNPGIEYVKWDCNRYVTNSGSQHLPAAKQSHLWVDNANGALAVMERVKNKFPNVTFMACSGGGGRIDYGSMRYFDEYWISDNGDPLQRIFIQWGSQHFFPTIGLASHVSASPSHISNRITPFKFRFDVAMAGKLGMDLQPSQMTKEEYAFSQKAIATYKDIRYTVLHGDLYRLLSPYRSNRTAHMYVAADRREAIVFSYLIRKEINGNRQTLVLKGLDPNKSYTVTEINRDRDFRFADYDGKTFSGEYLMKAGLTFTMYNEYESVVVKVQEK